MVEIISTTETPSAASPDNLSGPIPEHDPVLRASHPERNTFTFENGVRLTSEFETGNLWRCQEFAPDQANEIEPEEEEDNGGANGIDNSEMTEETKGEAIPGVSQDTAAGSDGEEGNNKYSLTDTATLFAPTEDELYCYDLWVCPDSMPYHENLKQKAQFYFGVTGLPAQSSVETRRTLRFRVMNESQQAKLLSYGHKPVYVILSNQEFQALQRGAVPVYSQKWQRIPNDVTWRRGKEGLCVAFEFTLQPEFKDKDHILFAYSQPFTRTDIDRSLVDLEEQCKAHGDAIYFHKEVLIRSLEGHPMHMVTLTANTNRSEVQQLPGADQVGD